MKSRIVQPAASFQPPDTCTEHRECQAAQTPLEDLRKVALEHYEKVTGIAHEWHSVIPKAINAYFDQQSLTTSDSARRAAEENLKAIIIRCEDGDPKANWLPIIARLAKEALGCLAAAPADNDAESLLPELTAVFVTNAIRVHTLSNHGCKWHDCLADVCHNNKELIQRAQGEQPTTTKGDR